MDVPFLLSTAHSMLRTLSPFRPITFNIQENMKDKKFKNLRYDLRENIVYHDDIAYGYKQLAHLSAFEVCFKFYKNSIIIEHLTKWAKSKGKEYKLEEMMKKFEEIFDEFEKEIPKPDTLIKSNIKRGFRIMGKEILNFLKDLDDTDNAPRFIRNFIFTNQGTINLESTVLEILEKEKNLNPETKFRLACNFFLDDQLIKDCFKNLPKNLQINFIKSSGKDSEFLSFWIWHCKNPDIDIGSSQEQVKSELEYLDSNIEEILCKSVSDRNGVQVQYLWENYISKRNDSENILQKVLPDFLNFSDNLDIFIYLLFQLESNHGEFFNKFFQTEGFRILKKLYEERWQIIFVEVFQVIYLQLDVRQHKDIINFLIHSSEDLKEQNLHFLKEISEEISPTVKNYLTQENAMFYCSLLKDLIKNKIAFAEVIFKIVGKGNFYIFLKEDGIQCFEELIKLRMFSYIDKIVKENFSTNDDVKLKKALENEVLPICCHYAKNGDLGGIEEFLEWMFTNKKLKDKINYLLYQGEGHLISSFFYRDEICEKDVSSIDTFLLKCLGSVKKVTEYKRCIVVAEEISEISEALDRVFIEYKTITDFVLSGKFRGLDFLLNWCFLNKDKIYKIKERLLYDYDLLNAIILKDNMVPLLNSFVSFCTKSPDEYIEFQRKILHATELHVSLFESGQYYAAKDLINWCSDFFEEETKQLKETLFPLVITKYVCHSANYKEFEDFKEWIDVSWISFIKCHFTAIGINLFRVNENFIYYHLHFLQKLGSFLYSPFGAEKADYEKVDEEINQDNEKVNIEMRLEE